MMLEQYGLTNYENRAYLSLLNLGIADARSVSTHSGVPYGRIYDTLDNLRNSKLISEISGRPKKYSAIDPELAVQRLIETKQEAVELLEKHASLTIQELSKIHKQLPKDQLIWKVAIGEELYTAYFDLIKEAKHEFLGYLEISDHFKEEISYVLQYQQLLREIADHGVTIKVLVGVSSSETLIKFLEEAEDLIDLVSAFELRYTSMLSHPFIVLDGEKAILKVSNPTKPGEMLAAVYLRQESLGKTLKSMFNQIWESANPIQLKLELEGN